MITVSRARSDWYSDALEIMFVRHPQDERPARVREVLDAVARGEVSLDGLLLAEENDQSVGAVLYVVQPDKTVFLWPAVASRQDTSAAVCDALYGEVCRQTDAAGAWLTQCLLERDEDREREALCRNGFGHLADLCYLQRSIDEPLPNLRGIDFTTVTFDAAGNRERFATLLERTYVETCDCPELEGKRTGLEALASHQTSGDFEPSRWMIYQIDQQDVGILLLNDHPDQNAWEVVYIGVVPAARGNGYSREMMIEALRAVDAAGRSSLLLAVDSRNSYAKNIYQELGFREIAVRSVHVRAHPERNGDK